VSFSEREIYVSAAIRSPTNTTEPSWLSNHARA
jgi:hypothetical protein